MSKKVNPELYEFMINNECGLYKDKYKNVKAYIHIPYYDLADFKAIIPKFCFEDGGLTEVVMFEDTICIELNSIIAILGTDLEDYWRCFDRSTWKEYMK